MSICSAACYSSASLSLLSCLAKMSLHGKRSDTHGEGAEAVENDCGVGCRAGHWARGGGSARIVVAAGMEIVGRISEGRCGRAGARESWQEPVNKTQRSTRERIQELARGRYRDYNDTHFTEELEKQHQLWYRVRLHGVCGVPSGKSVRASGVCHVTGSGGSGTVSGGCYCSWTAARTTGWKGVGRG